MIVAFLLLLHLIAHKQFYHKFYKHDLSNDYLDRMMMNGSVDVDKIVMISIPKLDECLIENLNLYTLDLSCH